VWLDKITYLGVHLHFELCLWSKKRGYIAGLRDELIGTPVRRVSAEELNSHSRQYLITFRVRRSRGEMYIGHGRLCLCLSVPRRIPTLLN